MELIQGRPLSKSGISVLEKCAFHYWANKYLGIADASSPAAEDGKMVHEWRAKVFGGIVTADFALANAENENVRFLTQLAIANDPYADAISRELEQETRINEKNMCVEDINLAVARGFLDDLALYEHHLVVEDLKTGRWEYDDPFERNLYAGLLAKAKYPDCFEIHFVRSFCRSGNRPTWIYRWSTILGVGKVVITHPDGKKEELLSGQLNPCVDILSDTIEKVKNTDPIPNQGKQCHNWFGSPCQFRDTICPAFQPGSELVMSTSTTLPSNQVIDAKAAIAAVKLADDDQLIALDDVTVSTAYGACLTVSAGIKQLEKKIKAWAEANGPFVVGDAKYGWHPEVIKRLDEPVALQMILESGMEIPEILKCVNISRSSCEKIPKRKWGELRDAVLKAAIMEDGTKNKFGVIEE